MIITARGRARDDGRPNDVDREFVNMFMIYDENSSWYLDETGRNSALWPDWTWRFRRRAARLDPAEYQLTAS